MASLTPKFSFRKPDGADAVNVTIDINETLDKIDKLYGGKALVKRTTTDMIVPHTGYSLGSFWSQLPVGTFVGRDDLDLRVKAVSGDWIEVGVSGLWDAQACDGYLDAIVKDANLSFGGMSNPLGGGATVSQGVLAWRGEPGRHSPIGGSVLKQLISSDIDGGGYVNVILIARVNSTSIRRNIWSNANIPFIWFLINHGSNL